MNKLRDKRVFDCASGTRTLLDSVLTVLLLIWPPGCGDQVHLPSAQQLIEFEHAGPSRPSLDIDRLVGADVSRGAYRVVPEDVLEFTMPAIVRFVTAEEADGGIDAATSYSCRVSQNGNITLPIVGDIKVSGKSLSRMWTGFL